MLYPLLVKSVPTLPEGAFLSSSSIPSFVRPLFISFHLLLNKYIRPFKKSIYTPILSKSSTLNTTPWEEKRENPTKTYIYNIKASKENG